MTARRALAAALAGTLGACSDLGIGGDAPPRIMDVRVEANAHNALSLIVSASAAEADSLRVRYEDASGRAATTPWMAATPAARLVVLGLRPATGYRLRMEARGRGRSARSGLIEAATGELPAGLRQLRLRGEGAPTSGYTLVTPVGPPTARETFIVMFDSAGDIAWYRAFRDQGWALEAKQQPNERITVYLGGSYGWQFAPGVFLELAPDGEVVRRFSAGAPAYTDPHELLLTERAGVTTAHLLSYEHRPYDLSAFGGAPAALLAVHMIERQVNGAVTFRWKSEDYFRPSDWPARATLPLDLVHPSSLELDHDDNYIVALQGIDQVVKVDGRSGAILWRLGGNGSTLEIVGDPLHRFEGPHSVRVLSTNHLLLMDNRLRADPPHARAVEYAIDPVHGLVRMVWQYAPQPPVTSRFMGSVQRLRNGNTLVGFGSAGEVHEVEAAGRAIWRARLTAGDGAAATPLYRAIRVRSLYAYQVP